jgi:hypothetical protein
MDPWFTGRRKTTCHCRNVEGLMYFSVGTSPVVHRIAYGEAIISDESRSQRPLIVRLSCFSSVEGRLFLRLGGMEGSMIAGLEGFLLCTVLLYYCPRGLEECGAPRS